MQLKGKKTVVVGLGVTGRAAARFLKDRGAVVRVTDSADDGTLAEAAGRMRALGIPVDLGPHRPETFDDADWIVVSPGVPHTLPALRKARDRGARLIGEMELASRFLTLPMIAVSGTNGKTTTTTLIGRMLGASGVRAFVGGNIGDPLIGFVASGQDADIAVVEVSSFQLDTAETFHPKVAVMLNVAEDHLDRYPGMAGYVAAKARLFSNQGPDDTAVVNGADPRVREMAGASTARRLVFGPSSPGTDAEGAELETKRIRIRMREIGTADISLERFGLQGNHNRENAAAAALAALAAGATVAGVQETVDGFSGLSHRLERVATVAGVTFYDDSKATNVDAVRRALEAFSSPVVLLLGGRDKGTDLKPLAPIVAGKVVRAVVMGESAPRLAQVLAPVVPVTEAPSMAAAVESAFSESRPGTVVLLSPACASFDWYENYARRGEDYCRAVKAIQQREEDR